MKESVKDRRDTFEDESRISIVPGTLPVTEGTALESETEIEVAQNKVSTALYDCVAARETEIFVSKFRAVRVAQKCLRRSFVDIMKYDTKILHEYVEKLKAENPAWVADVKDAFGEVTVTVPRESIVRCLQFSENEPRFRYARRSVRRRPRAGRRPAF